MSDRPAVLVEDMVKRYPVFEGFRDLLRHPWTRRHRTALDGVSLCVGRGRVFCLLGPNGAGKTTLIKVLATLVLPDGGRAMVDGHDVEKCPADVRGVIGYAIPDERSFYWRLTGQQNLEFFGALNGLRGGRLRTAVADVLALTGLGAAADLRFNAYSTGMRQMLAFARALLADAEILLVDEPTRSLDPQAAAGVRAFLKRDLAAGRGKTVLWATHDLAEAAEAADDIAILDRGRIRAAGTVGELTCGGRISLRGAYDRALAAPAAEGR